MGGKAIKNCSRIKQSEVQPIVKEFSRILKDIGFLDFSVVGSAGKKNPEETSGDIDFAVDEKELNVLGGLSKIKDKLLTYTENIDSVVVIKGFGMLSCGYKNGKNIAQVDVIPVSNVEYANWMMYSPNWTDSPYKSGVRNSILYWTLSEKYHCPMKYNDDDIEVLWSRYIFDHNVGVVRLVQTIEGKNGNILKNKKTIERTTADVEQTPESVISLCFGNEALESGCKCLTTEQAWTMLRQAKCLTVEQKKNIIRNVIEECEYKGFNYPEEFKEAVL